MTTQEIRHHFLRYFKERGHTIVPSSPVVPHHDPTLLFNNAGMNQFKDVFLGEGMRDYTCATTAQKCIRAGGKHNDLENVGHTSRHLTFFEMLGNFSFGDYFKKEAIQYSWELSTEVFGFAPESLWVSVFTDDDEAFELWKQYLPEERIARFGEEENFWSMGDTGPCGPCSELYYDRGPKYGNLNRLHDDPDSGRFLEFWNLVFMQYNRTGDGAEHPLPKPSIDTGSGLERVMQLIQQTESVYETDVLRSLIAEVENLSGKSYDPRNFDAAAPFRVIADHVRCLAFAIGDGVQPSNVDRGYVLRKVLRRAVRYGRMLGLEKPFLARVLPRLIDAMGSDYKELVHSENRISEILTTEEEAFLRTLKRGGNMLGQIVEESQKGAGVISGDDAFKLKDTYGFPVEEVVLLAKDSNLTVDLDRFNTLEQEAKERSRQAHQVTQQVAGENMFAAYLEIHDPCEFVGFSEYTCLGKVTALVFEGNLVEMLEEGQEGLVVLDQTPFYAEMGGQVGDTGTLAGADQHFLVTNCQAPFKGVSAHVGLLKEGTLRLGDTLTATVDQKRRQKIANNHTATHLLHWALHQVLGKHATQAGSVVEPKRLRFDFSHHKALTDAEVRQIEDLINTKIRENASVKWYEIPFDEAQKREDIHQFFGEKYGSVVRVVDLDYSLELCGGTHTTATGTIGLFRIVKEGSIAAGIRRIDAVTGEEAEAFSRKSEEVLEALSERLKIQPAKVQERIDKLLEENKKLQEQLKEIERGELDSIVESLIQTGVETIEQMPLIAAQITLSPDQLAPLADAILKKLPSCVVVLGASNGDRCQLLARVSEDLVGKGVHANTIIKTIAPLVGGGGGGKAHAAQAGGKIPEQLPEALAQVKEILKSH